MMNAGKEVVSMKNTWRAAGTFLFLLLLLLSAGCQTTSVSYIEAYRLTFLPPMQETNVELRGLFPPERGYECKCRLKKTASMQEKVIRKGYAGVEDITDIAGCRVVLPCFSDIPKVDDAVQKHFQVVERVNLLEDKRGSGYRAVHYLVEKNGKIVEIQLQTVRQAIWGSLSYHWVYKGPYRESEGVKRYLLNLSRAIYALDMGEETVLPEPPPGLPRDFLAAANKSLGQLRAMENKKVDPCGKRESSLSRQNSQITFAGFCLLAPTTKTAFTTNSRETILNF